MTLQPVAFFPDNQLRVIRRSDPRAGRLLSTQSNRQSRLLLLQIRPTLILLSDTDTTSTRCNSLFRNVAYRALFSIFIEQTSRYILDYVRPMDRCRISLRPAIKFGPFRRENIRTNSQDAACDRPPEPTYLTYFTTYKLFFPLLCPALVARIAFSRRTVRSRGTIRACVYRSGWKKPRDQFARVPRGASKPEGKG